MGLYDVGWREIQDGKGYHEKSNWSEFILNCLLILVGGYCFWGIVSFAAIAAGYDISYMPFWHEPWKWLLQATGVLKEVVPNGTGVPV